MRRHRREARLPALLLGLLVRHSFSKAEEHEADVYAFILLASSRYDPAAMGSAFASLQRFQDSASSFPGGGGRGEAADPLRDYFSSHPPLPLRREEFRQALESLALPGEWRQGAGG